MWLVAILPIVGKLGKIGQSESHCVWIDDHMLKNLAAVTPIYPRLEYKQIIAYIDSIDLL
jgi:hypothetical protein